ncbi:MAG: CinA family protein [Thermoplasmata archaeon]|nr:CinA family protein [Thermoplasmata archaeon]MBR4685173.1 CinA family protein [Candidatus Methanomethylophilaceae archaeon]WII07259.1 CinA family protein [Methanomassiliicoccales archaeon LGM-RCC1]
MPRSEVESLLDVLRSKGLRMSAAESCTGGMIGSLITDLPGASDVFLGSAVTYSNESKEALLKVSHETLLQHGAVSEETAREMALGSIEAYGSDVAVAVTGIAGPGGATETKPVGLVYIAVADGPRTIVTRNLFKGDRQSVREQTAMEAIRLLTELAEGRLRDSRDSYRYSEKRDSRR